MRNLLWILTLSLTPALAHAGIDYKCTDQIDSQSMAVLRFDPNGSSGQIEINHWESFPPTVMVDAKIASKTSNADGSFRIVSAPDIEGSAIATLNVPANYLQADHFFAQGDVQYVSPETRQLIKTNYKFDCVRQ